MSGVVLSGPRVPTMALDRFGLLEERVLEGLPHCLLGVIASSRDGEHFAVCGVNRSGCRKAIPIRKIRRKLLNTLKQTPLQIMTPEICDTHPG